MKDLNIYKTTSQNPSVPSVDSVVVQLFMGFQGGDMVFSELVGNWMP